MTNDVIDSCPSNNSVAEFGAFTPGIEDPAEQAYELRWCDPSKALKIIKSIRTSGFDRREDPAAKGRVLHLEAFLLQQLGYYQDALISARFARTELLTAGLKVQAVSTDVISGLALCELGDYRRSYDVGRHLLDSIGDLADHVEAWEVSRLRAGASLAIGAALMCLDSPAAALGQLDRASNLYYACNEIHFQFMAERWRGMAYIKLGMAHRALADLQNAQERARHLDSTLPVARFALPIADALIRVDRNADALRVLEDASPVFERFGARPEIARLKLTTSNALVYLDLIHDARLEARDAAETLLDMGMVAESAIAELTAGTTALILGRIGSAEREFDLAERRLADCEDRLEHAYARLSQAWLAIMLGKFAQAGRIASVLLEAPESASDELIQSLAHLISAMVDTNGKSARTHISAASKVINTHQFVGLRQALSLLQAREAHQRGDLADAAAILRNHLRPRTDFQQGAVDTRLGFIYVLLHSSAQDALVRVLLEIGTIPAMTEAWQLCSQAKTSPTDGAYSVTAARGDAYAQADERTNENDARAALSELYDRMHEFGRHERDSQMSSAILALRRQLRRSQALPTSRYSAANGLVPRVPEGPLLQYHVLGGDIVAFVIREGQVYARLIPESGASARALLRDWHTECTRLALFPGSARSPNKSSETSLPLVTLSKILFAPIEDLLSDLESGPLMIQGHRYLHNIPFEALSSQTTGSGSLLSNFQLAFARSFTVPSSAAIETNKRHGLLVLAAPDAHAPEIAAEAAAISNIRPEAEVYVGAEASTALLTSRAAQFDVIHIACHGIFLADNPSCSALRLGDRWITAGEIAQLEVSGAFIILNACSSSETSELMASNDGIASAFLCAGSRGIISTNWNVDDVVAAKFARSLHEQIACDEDPIRALQSACIKIMWNYPHPSAWAAYRYTSTPTVALVDGNG